MRVLSILKSVLLPVGLVVIGVLAVLSMTAEAPKRAGAPSYTADPNTWLPMNQLSLLRTAQSDFETNETNADSAPKQQVVAGWAAKDLLSVIGLQNADTMNGLFAINNNLLDLQKAQANTAQVIEASVPPIDNRPRRLLGLGVVALCWLGMWTAVPAGVGAGRKKPGVTAEVASATTSPLPAPEVPAASHLSTPPSVPES